VAAPTERAQQINNKSKKPEAPAAIDPTHAKILTMAAETRWSSGKEWRARKKGSRSGEKARKGTAAHAKRPPRPSPRRRRNRRERKPRVEKKTPKSDQRIYKRKLEQIAKVQLEQ